MVSAPYYHKGFVGQNFVTAHAALHHTPKSKPTRGVPPVCKAGQQALQESLAAGRCGESTTDNPTGVSDGSRSAKPGSSLLPQAFAPSRDHIAGVVHLK